MIPNFRLDDHDTPLSEMAHTDLLDKWEDVMSRLEDVTLMQDYELHLEALEICRHLGEDLQESVEVVWNLMAHRFILPEADWARWIADLEKMYGADQGSYGAEAILEVFKRASKVTYSPTLQAMRVKYVCSQHHILRGSPPPNFNIMDADQQSEDHPMSNLKKADKSLLELFTLEKVREIADDAMSQVQYHLTDSSKVWFTRLAFELDMLKRKPSDPSQNAEVQALFEARLKTPHLDHDLTWQAFSRFTTQQSNDHYEAAMVNAQAFYGPAKAKADERELEELKLKQAGNSLEAYQAYLGWELAVKKPDLSLVRALFERTLHAHVMAEEVWQDYDRFIRTHNVSDDPSFPVHFRATMGLPWSGKIWSMSIRNFEREGEDIERTFRKAIQTELFDMEGIIDITQTAADTYRHSMDVLRQAGVDPETDSDFTEFRSLAVSKLKTGIKLVGEASKKGDPTCTLEKYLTSLLQDYPSPNEEDSIKTIRDVWTKSLKYHRNLASVWLMAISCELRMKVPDYALVRELFKSAASAKLDYPEYLLTEWTSFEHQHGSLDDMEQCMYRVKGLRKGIASRREREAQAAAQATTAIGQPVADPAASLLVPSTSNVKSDAGVTQRSGEGKKRGVEEDLPRDAEAEAAAEIKRIKTEHAPVDLKRDREHCTVLVNSILSTHTETDIQNLFADCGEVREIVLTPLADGQAVASVEFKSRDSVLPALTKDKKRIQNVEVEVHLAWQSTLYVTNFAEGVEETTLRDLFSKFGPIMEIRKPSKKIKTNRRFCYIQYIKPELAQEALQLHGHAIDSSHKLNVLISNPERKKERSDVDAWKCEIYFTGISPKTDEVTIQKIFEKHGKVKQVRLVRDAQGNSKRYGFVTFETPDGAQSSLSLNNHEVHGRRMAITIADSKSSTRHAQSTTTHQQSGSGVAGFSKVADVKSRSVKLRGVGIETTDVTISNVLEESVGTVKNIKRRGEEISVEFEDAACVGKMLLATNPIVIDGVTVTVLSEESSETDQSSFRPRAMNKGRGRGRVGLGARGRGRGANLGLGTT